MPPVRALPHRLIAAVRRAFGQFLALPLATILGFVALAAAVYVADDAWSKGQHPPGLGWLGTLLGDRQALDNLLTTVASGIITVTSITFSLLLIAVQQGASALTAQVTDQFMLRRSNQFYFGYFVGLSVFILVTLVTNTAFHRPIFGTSLAIVLTTVALCMIIVMIYNTVDQMRPAQIVGFIHGRILSAREAARPLLAATRRSPRPSWPVVATIRSPESGHVAAVRPDAIRDAVRRLRPGTVELELQVAIGSRVAAGDPLFLLRVDPHAPIGPAERDALGEAALRALRFDDGRDLNRDAEYGLYQLAMIAWTSTSTAKSNPSPGQAVIAALRDIIARWSPEEEAPPGDDAAALVYRDRAPAEATAALEDIVVVASESIQVQTLADALDTVAILLGHVSQPTALRLEDVARRALSSLGEHVLTARLEASLARLAEALDRRGFTETGAAVAEATSLFRRSVGLLNSRSTRVPPP